MALTKKKHPNAYKPWGQEEDTLLTQLFCEGKKPTEISMIVKRNRGAIASRIAKLELDKKTTEGLILECFHEENPFRLFACLSGPLCLGSDEALFYYPLRYRGGF